MYTYLCDLNVYSYLLKKDTFMICAVKYKKDEQQTNKDTEMRGLKMHQRTAVLHQKTIQYSSVFVQRRFFLQVLHAS